MRTFSSRPNVLGESIALPSLSALVVGALWAVGALDNPKPKEPPLSKVAPAAPKQPSGNVGLGALTMPPADSQNK